MVADLLALAQARKSEIAKLMADLKEEDTQLSAFLDMAKKLELQLTPSAAPSGVFAGLEPRKATKKDVVSAALVLIHERRGAAVSTGDVVEVLTGQGFQMGGGSSSPSSVVSANLSAATEIERNPNGPGWVESEANKLL